MKIAFVGAGLMALVAVPLVAQPGPPPGEMHGPMMKPITKADAQAMVAKHFAELDLNHDGKVTQEEVKAFRGTRMEERIKEHRDREFSRLDSNHDGAISKSEFDVAHPGGPGGPAGHDRPPMGEHGGPDHGRGPMGGGMMLLGMHWFEKADANHDGAVTLAEAQTAAATFFDRLDTNHDGIVSPDEIRAAFGGRGPGGWHRHGMEGHGGPEGDMPPPPPSK